MVPFDIYVDPRTILAANRALTESSLLAGLLFFTSSVPLLRKAAGQDMTIAIRPIQSSDAVICGEIIYRAFKGLAESHGFPPDFPSVEMAKQLAATFIAHPLISGVAAEDGGQLLGSNFLVKTDPIYGVGPITVEPSVQGRGIGRKLMEAVLELGQNAIGIRLVQDAFNTQSISLYASLGFDAKEPLMLMLGRPASKPVPGFNVRPLSAEDVKTCAALCKAVHGISRSGELRDALSTFMPLGVERDGVLTGYLTAPTFWIMNHGVAQTEQDMRALILGSSAASSEPLSFLLPLRESSLFRWCLGEGFRVVKPMTLMAMGQYQESRGCFFPSVLY
jgi:GNAT superfamily N-acetyltransferase